VRIASCVQPAPASAFAESCGGELNTNDLPSSLLFRHTPRLLAFGLVIYAAQTIFRIHFLISILSGKLRYANSPNGSDGSVCSAHHFPEQVCLLNPPEVDKIGSASSLQVGFVWVCFEQFIVRCLLLLVIVYTAVTTI